MHIDPPNQLVTQKRLAELLWLAGWLAAGVDLFYKDKASAPNQALLFGAALPWDFGEVFTPGTACNLTRCCTAWLDMYCPTEMHCSTWTPGMAWGCLMAGPPSQGSHLLQAITARVSGLCGKVLHLSFVLANPHNLLFFCFFFGVSQGPP